MASKSDNLTNQALPWSVLHTEAPSHFPPDPNLKDISTVRMRSIHNEPMWGKLVDQYGESAVWNILNAGSREIIEDGQMQLQLRRAIFSRLDNLIGDRTGDEGKRMIRTVAHLDQKQIKENTDVHLDNITRQMAPHPVLGVDSARILLAQSGALFNMYYGVATPRQIRPIMHEEASYLRYNPSKNPVYRDTLESLLKFYNLPIETYGLITGKGKQAINLIYETLFQDYHPQEPEARMINNVSRTVVIGDMYKESLEQLRLYGIASNYPDTQDVPLEEIFANLDQQLGSDQGKKVALFMVDPLENSASAGTHNIAEFITKVAELAKKTNTTAFVVSDISLSAGEVDINEIGKNIPPDSNTVFITVESLMKYFGLGSDLTYLGAITMQGNEKVTSDFWTHLIGRYRRSALAPSVVDLGTFPPVVPEIMHHRANRIRRNRDTLMQIVKEAHPDLVLNSHGNEVGFTGGLFWVDLQKETTVNAVLAELDEALAYGQFGSIMARDGFGYQQTTISSFGDHLRVSAGNEDLFLTFCEAQNMSEVLSRHFNKR